MRAQEVQSHGVPVRPHRPVAHRKKPDRMTHRTGGSRFPGFAAIVFQQEGPILLRKGKSMCRFVFGESSLRNRIL